MDQEKVINVGSRKSPLALIQTEYIIMLLNAKFPDKKFNIVKMSTMGDNILDVALSKIGEKNLFTKTLEDAMLDGRVDLVVHSLKDLPTVLPEGLVIGSIIKRDDPHDAVVMHPKYMDQRIDTLPEGSVIGTSSLRRTAQLKRHFPKLQFMDIRGNINTRLHKLDGANKYAALVLAVAGLHRMGWQDRITHILKPEDCMYAVSQGALAVECRVGDNEILPMLQTLMHYETLISVVAERAFLMTLEGGCSVPVAVNTTIVDDVMCLDGGVYLIDGSDCVIDTMKTDLGNPDEPDKKKNGLTEHPALGDMRRQFVGIDGGDVSKESLRAAEQIGIDLAVKILNNGGAEMLTVTKKEMKLEIEKQVAEKELEKKELEMKEKMEATNTGKIAQQMILKQV